MRLIVKFPINDLPTLNVPNSALEYAKLLNSVEMILNAEIFLIDCETKFEWFVIKFQERRSKILLQNVFYNQQVFKCVQSDCR